MDSVVLVIHLFLALAIIGLVLLQRSEGGGLGMGGGLGGLASPRGATNALTRATAICAAAFFCTSLLLAIMAGGRSTVGSGSILDALDEQTPAAIEQPVAPPTETLPDNPSPMREGGGEAPKPPIAE